MARGKPKLNSRRRAPLGYAHQSRGLSAEMLIGNAFELVPDAPFVPPPPGGYPCAWIGRAVGFNTHGGGPGDVEYTGASEEEKDASCCARCDCEPECEFWERDTGSNKCSLRKNFAGFDVGATGTRGNFKNASKGSCTIADDLLLSGTGWLRAAGRGRALLDNSSSPVPQGLWAPPSRSLLLRGRGDGATNRGFAGEGLYLQGGKPYEGYLVLQSRAGPHLIFMQLCKSQPAGAVGIATAIPGTKRHTACGIWPMAHT